MEYHDIKHFLDLSMKFVLVSKICQVKQSEKLPLFTRVQTRTLEPGIFPRKTAELGDACVVYSNMPESRWNWTFSQLLVHRLATLSDL